MSLETEDKDHAWLNAVKKRTDTFLLQQAYMKERAGLLKEEVREIIKGTNELPKILDLIATLQRLGLDNHYEIEIDEHLCSVYNSSYDVKDLNLVSLRFYLLRKHGYDVSSGKAILLV